MADKTKEVPSEKEIAELPRWAQVAFAARCARRVQPLLQASWPELLEKRYHAAVEKAIRQAVACAGVGAAPLEPAVGEGAGAREAYRYAWSMGDAAIDDHCDPSAARGVAYAAKAGADAYAAVYDAASAYAAANAASEAGGNAGPAWRKGLVRAMWMDFDELKTAAKMERWTDETPVPPEFFGPLWPEGEPPGWPSTAARPTRRKKAQTASKEERLVVQASVHVPVDDETLVDGITELYQALNRYHILCGGTGLTIDDWKIFVRSGTRKRELV